MKRYLVSGILRLLFGLGLLALAIDAHGQYVTLTGTLQASNGLPALNRTISFAPSQWGFIAGTGVIVQTTTFCGTDSLTGAVVGITAPLQRTINTPAYSGGTLPAANYFVVYAWITAVPTVTQVSPESTAQLTATGNLQVALPAGPLPAGVTGYNVYISTTSGAETLQGSVTGSGVYTQSVPLVTGAAQPVTNTTVCKQIANDAIWPVGTGYTVSLTDSNGNTQPGYPMMWQLLGPNTSINLSNGLPYYHGVVTFPVPVLASPLNHATQSISGGLSLGTYPMWAGSFGVNVVTPFWGVDVQGVGAKSRINAKGGYLVNGNGGTVGLCLGSDGTSYDTPIACSSAGFYQTVLANGTAKPQEPSINLINGSNATVTCVDNPGSSRTDCTFTSTAMFGPNPNIPTITGTSVVPRVGYNDGAGYVTVGTGSPTFTLTLGGTYATAPVCTANTNSATGIVNVGANLYPITQWATNSPSTGIAAFTGSFTGLTAGTTLQLDGFTTGSFFNGQTVTVLSSGLSPTQFEANFTHATTNATETGVAIPNAPYSYSFTASGVSSLTTIGYLCHE